MHPIAAIELAGLRAAATDPKRTSRICLWRRENYLRLFLLLDQASESPRIVQ